MATSIFKIVYVVCIIFLFLLDSVALQNCFIKLSSRIFKNKFFS